MELGEIYFWTATIHKWNKLLTQESFKKVILSSLQYLSSKDKIEVFAFVIMPNHIHLIWRIREHNGKETSQGAFLKYTAHHFKKMLDVEQLRKFKVEESNKAYEFWQRDSLAIPLYSAEVAFQKLDYLHDNPLAEHWALAQDPSDYYYSTASFYEKGEKRFPFIKDLREEF